MGFFIPVSSLKVFGHSIHSERRRIYLGKSIQALQNDTIIISWVFSFRVIQLTVRWHTLKTFMFVFINFCSSKKTFRDSRLLKYLVSKELMLSVTRYKPKLSHGLTCHFMLDSLHWCAKQRNSNKRAPGRVVIYISPFSINLYFLTFSNVLLVLALNLIVHKSSYYKCSLAWYQVRTFLLFTIWTHPLQMREHPLQYASTDKNKKSHYSMIENEVCWHPPHLLVLSHM